jgi:hypothetical protein
LTSTGANEDDAPSEEDILDHEEALIRRTRKARLGTDALSPWCGLGLSGGGIRSASLGLGVLQALAEKDILKRFDYISSVSGGGYIATSLQWWWSRPREDIPDPNTQTFGVGPADFPYGPARPDPAAQAATTSARAGENLTFLRAHSSYLTPGNGLSIWSILGVLLRTIVISLLTWIPVLTAIFVGISLVGYGADILANAVGLWSPLGPLLPVRWTDLCKTFKCDLEYSALYAILLWASYAISCAFVFAAILFALVSRAPQDNRHRFRTVVGLGIAAALGVAALVYLFGLYPASAWDVPVAVIAVILVIVVAVAVLVVLSELLTTRSLNASYWLRRSIERLLGQAFIPSLAVLASSTIPILPYYGVQSTLTANHLTIGGVLGLLSGLGSALYGYYTFLRNIVPGMVGEIAATLGAIVYLYATLVIAYTLAMTLLNYHDLSLDNYVLIGLLSAIVVGFSLGLFANINYVGFHRFYRDRLMEAFMPTDRSVTAIQANYSPVADNLLVTDLTQFFQSPGTNALYKPRPYPLINSNAILINDSNQKFASRGGDNFIISPLYIGSKSTGWQDSTKYIERNGPLTLASAMAASGAAANASAGYIGTGITMNPLVSSVMSLLNIRLGMWVGNPFYRQTRRVRSIPTFLMAGIYPGFAGQLHRHESNFLELTDGGHFENLGLYELVRRKLEVIVVVDGEEDPSISLSSLVSAARRIEQDFGARLIFYSGRGPERLMMYPSQGYPSGVRYAEAPFLVGEISYNDGSKGILIYIKATLIKQMDFTTSGYLAANPSFPHQTTANQFFSPDQFDAYRFLGYECAIQMISALQLATTIATPAAILAKYQETTAAAAV